MTNLTTFQAMGTLPFMQHFPVTQIGSQPHQVPAPPGAPPAGPYETGSPTASVAKVSQGARINHFDIVPHTGGPGALTSAGTGAPMNMRLNNRYGGGLPVYYLPYNNDEHHRVTLTNKQAIPNDNFFLTALVDGCSVYVEGTDQNPSVTHLNAIGTRVVNPSPDLTGDQVRRIGWLLKYAEMDRRFANDGTKPKRVVAGVGLRPSRKLEAKDYMIEPGSDEETAFEQTLPALKATNRAPTNVLGQSVDEMRLVMTQGTVFGVRAGGGGNWRFYVQRRALVEYFHITAVPVPEPDATIGERIRYLGRGGPPPRYGPAPVQINRQSLGMQWIIRDVPEFWPGGGTGRNV